MMRGVIALACLAALTGLNGCNAAPDAGIEESGSLADVNPVVTEDEARDAFNQKILGESGCMHMLANAPEAIGCFEEANDKAWEFAKGTMKEWREHNEGLFDQDPEVLDLIAPTPEAGLAKVRRFRSVSSTACKTMFEQGSDDWNVCQLGVVMGESYLLGNNIFFDDNRAELDRFGQGIFDQQPLAQCRNAFNGALADLGAEENVSVDTMPGWMTIPAQMDYLDCIGANNEGELTPTAAGWLTAVRKAGSDLCEVAVAANGGGGAGPYQTLNNAYCSTDIESIVAIVKYRIAAN